MSNDHEPLPTLPIQTSVPVFLAATPLSNTQLPGVTSQLLDAMEDDYRETPLDSGPSIPKKSHKVCRSTLARAGF
jgi:hypothetical protein